MEETTVTRVGGGGGGRYGGGGGGGQYGARGGGGGSFDVKPGDGPARPATTMFRAQAECPKCGEPKPGGGGDDYGDLSLRLRRWRRRPLRAPRRGGGGFGYVRQAGDDRRSTSPRWRR